MVTVKRIGQCRGYSGEDHLLDDGPLTSMIGRSYRDAAAAKRAANNVQKKHCGSMVPVWIVLDVCGDEVEITC